MLAPWRVFRKQEAAQQGKREAAQNSFLPCLQETKCRPLYQGRP